MLSVVLLHYCNRKPIEEDNVLQEVQDSLDYYKAKSDSLEALEPEIIIIREKAKANETSIDSFRAIYGSFTDIYYQITNDSIR